MSADTSPLDVDHLRSWIGREDVATDLVSADLARKYHATFDLPGDPPAAGAPVPRLIHFCLAQPSVPTAGLGTDGHPARGGFLPPVPLPRRMWAGGSLVFHDDLRVGDAVRRLSRIEDVTVKKGRTGTLCFVSVSHRIEVAGAVRIEERQDIVYRDIDAAGARSIPEGDATQPAAAPPPAAAAPAEPGEHIRALTADARLLFRYSALTFNAHRIHYDRHFASEIEGYPGLVVHGPLQAALLMNFATELAGTPPAHFDFRGLSPLFDGEPFTLNASGGSAGMKLWSARRGGPVSMSATASWA